jgi:hypothetical protein
MDDLRKSGAALLGVVRCARMGRGTVGVDAEAS